MLDPARLQRHLRETLRLQSQPTRVGPYTLYHHPEAPYGELNLAIPDEPGEGRRVPIGGAQPPAHASVADEDAEYALTMLEAQFRARQRTPRVEFLLECQPELPPVLENAGYRESARVPLLAATKASWRAAPDVPGLRFEAVLPTTPWETTRRYLEVQREAYGLDVPVPQEEPRDAWGALAIGAGVLAIVDDEAVGAGGFTAPVDGLCEIRGLAVVPQARRKGVGTFLLSSLAHVAHEGGIEAVLATPDGPATARLAKRAGYKPVATLVSFTMEDAAAP